eukprot:6658440-Pyramimonas_sp.AAC.1
MLGQMTSVMDNVAALGELTRLGNALAQSQQQPTVPTPGCSGVTAQPPPAAPAQTTGVSTTSEPARELVGALTDVFRSSVPGDARLQQTVDRLHRL